MSRLHLGLVVLALLSAGCLEWKEEIRVAEDGSVVLRTEMIQPDSLDGWGMPIPPPSPGLVSEGLMSDSVTYRREYVADRKRHHVLTRDFAALADLAGVIPVDKAGVGDNLRGLGSFEVTPFRQGKVRVRHRFPGAKPPPGTGLNMQDRRLLGDVQRILSGDSTVVLSREDSVLLLFRHVPLHVVMRAPSILSTNGRLSADGTTAEWRTNMLEVFADTSFVMEAVFGKVR